MTWPPVLVVEQKGAQMCAICGRPLEQHDTRRLEEEIAGCARMSAARVHAGKTIRPFEQFCLDRTESSR